MTKRKSVKLMLAMTALISACVFAFGGCSSDPSNNNDDVKQEEPANEIVACSASKVTTTYGDIVGSVTEDGEVYSYKGIPYAAAPVGNLRWKATQPHEGWSGTRECLTYGASAMQTKQAPAGNYTKEFIIDTDNGYSEDCLTLNVWTQSDTSVKNKPIIVYIHGGGFTTGGSSCEAYSGESIVRQGVVYANINYRLGIFGWMATDALKSEDSEAVGNYGLLDMIMAINWIKDNAAVFGGDANNVTVVGQSAGAACVNALISSPKAAGLFQHAVSLSDVCGDGPSLTERIAASTDANNKTLEELRSMSAEDVMKLSVSSSGPCIGSGIVPNSYIQSLKDGTANDVDIICGMLVNDGSKSKSVAVSNYVAMARTANGKYTTNVYNYYYTHKMPGTMPGSTGECFHTSDVPYFLNYFSSVRAKKWTEDDYNLGKTMSAYLVNFSKTGNPNGEGLVEWTANTGDYSYLALDVESIMAKLSEADIANVEVEYADILNIIRSVSE